MLYPSKLRDSPYTSKAVAGQRDAALLLWTEEATSQKMSFLDAGEIRGKTC